MTGPAWKNEKLKGLGGADILRKARPVLDKCEADINAALSSFDMAVVTARSGLDAVRSEWNKRRDDVNNAHETTLRELQKEGIDGSEYTNLLEKIELLEPKKEERIRHDDQLKEVQKERRAALADWEDIVSAEFRALEKAAKRERVNWPIACR